MRLSRRSAQACDLKTCAERLTVRDRYRNWFAKLPNIWCALLRRESLLSVVIEDIDRPEGDRTVGFGVSVFLTDDFVQQTKASSLSWIGPELIRRISGNASPVLDCRSIAEANSREGLNEFLWEFDVRPVPDAAFLSTATALIQAILEYDAGFQIKEAIAQPPFGRMLRTAIQIGGHLWDPARGRYTTQADADALTASSSPFVLGFTREIARQHPGSWLSSLFRYTPPRLRFTQAEQRLLSTALSGRTDKQIAEALRLSVSAVKKGWQSIYAKVGLRLPDLLPDDSCGLLFGSGRGTEKRRRVLAYVQSHPEELRPTRAAARNPATSNRPVCDPLPHSER